jgi:hypothetical protein
MNIDREFIKWFYEEVYPEQGSNRRQAYSMTQGTQNINIIDYWMREAFKAGAKAAASDTLETLEDYACATSGLPAELISPDKIYDRAYSSLEHYYKNEYEIGTLEEQKTFDAKRNYPL